MSMSARKMTGTSTQKMVLYSFLKSKLANTYMEVVDTRGDASDYKLNVCHCVWLHYLFLHTSLP